MFKPWTDALATGPIIPPAVVLNFQKDPSIIEINLSGLVVEILK